MSAEARNGGRARGGRLHILIAAGALPLLVACSSSSSVEYATDAFPSQSLADMLKASKDSPPPAPSVAPAAPTAADASPTVPAPAEPPPVSATAAATPPPSAKTPSESDDPVAAAFPSVSLIDLVTGARKPGAQ